MSNKNHYTVLGIKSDASFQEIKATYRSLAKKHHPDRNNGSPFAEETFKELQQAYTVLSNPHKRRNYDLTLPLYERTIYSKKNIPKNGPYAFAKTAGYSSDSGLNSSMDTEEKQASSNDFSNFLISIVLAAFLLLFIVFYKV